MNEDSCLLENPCGFIESPDTGFIESPGTGFIESLFDISQVISEAFAAISSDTLLMSYKCCSASGRSEGILVYTRFTGKYICDLTCIYSLEFKELPKKYTLIKDLIK